MPFFLFLSLLFFCPLSAELEIHNRVLFPSQEKSISLLDVVEKLDFILSKSSKEELSESQRLEFYRKNWLQVFHEMLQRELVLKEAKQRNIQVADAEIREKIDSLFGSDVSEHLEALQLSYSQLWSAIHDDILTERVLWVWVKNPLFQQLRLQDLRDRYQENYLQKDPYLWRYRILNLRHKEKEKLLAHAQELLEALRKGEENFSQIEAPSEDFIYKLSPQLEHAPSDLQPSMRSLLETLQEGDYALWGPEKRAEYFILRIFLLEESKEEEIPSFAQIEESLREEILSERLKTEMQRYFALLGRRYHVDIQEILQALPKDYQPFSS